MYRTSRPFRIIPRVLALKKTAHMLFMSVKPIGNLLLMGVIFYVIFAIWGVQLFAGKFFYCTESIVNTSKPYVCEKAGGTLVGSATYVNTMYTPSIQYNNNTSSSSISSSSSSSTTTSISSSSVKRPEGCTVSVYQVRNKQDCEVGHGEWKRRQYHFDNAMEVTSSAIQCIIYLVNTISHTCYVITMMDTHTLFMSKAMLTLFVVSSKDGWAEIMRYCFG